MAAKYKTHTVIVHRGTFTDYKITIHRRKVTDKVIWKTDGFFWWRIIFGKNKMLIVTS
jgi:hypothetical protein